MPITDRQQAILDHIVSHVNEHGYPPTIRSIGKAMGISSTSVVNYHLNKLKKAGRLVRTSYISRGLVLTGDTAPITVTPGADVVVMIDGVEVVAPFARLAA